MQKKKRKEKKMTWEHNFCFIILHDSHLMTSPTIETVLHSHYDPI